MTYSILLHLRHSAFACCHWDNDAQHQLVVVTDFLRLNRRNTEMQNIAAKIQKEKLCSDLKALAQNVKP